MKRVTQAAENKNVHQKRETRLVLNTLLSEGRKLLLSAGAEVSVDEICAVARCSKGAFYHHFPTKRDFLLAALAGGAPLSTEETLRMLPAAMRDGGVAAALVWRGPRRVTRPPNSGEATALGARIRRTLSI